MITLTDPEIEALRGLPHIQITLYVLGLRPYMDFRTGIVGVTRGISWQSLREALYIEPAPGLRGTGNQTKDVIRGAAKALERAGLIKNQGKQKQLIFKCLLARTDKSDQNKVAIKSPYQVTTSQANKYAASSKEVTTPKSKEVTTPPRIRDINTTSTVNSEPVVDDDNLIFSEKLTGGNLEAIKNALSKSVLSVEMKQNILDELAGQMNAKVIKSPVGYFRKILESAGNGSFNKERALIIQETRQKQKHIQTQMKLSNEKALEGTPAEKRQKSKPSIPLTEFLKQKKEA